MKKFFKRLVSHEGNEAPTCSEQNLFLILSVILLSLLLTTQLLEATPTERSVTKPGPNWDGTIMNKHSIPDFVTQIPNKHDGKIQYHKATEFKTSFHSY